MLISKIGSARYLPEPVGNYYLLPPVRVHAAAHACVGVEKQIATMWRVNPQMYGRSKEPPLTLCLVPLSFSTLLVINVLKTNICSAHTSVLHLQHIYTELWSIILAFFRVSLLRLYLCESVFRGLWVDAGKLLVNTIKSREMLLQTAPHTEHPGGFLLAFQ